MAVLLCVLLVAGAAPSCGSRARLDLADGSGALGKIVDSDDQGVVVESEFEERFYIERADIKDIDHPGNITATLAAAAVPLGYAFALIDYGHCMNTETEDSLHKCDKRRKKFSIIGNVIAGASAPVIVWALTTWGLSRTRASRSSLSSEKGEKLQLGFLGLAPLAGQRGLAGGMVSLWRF